MQGRWRRQKLNFYTTVDWSISFMDKMYLQVEHNKPISTYQNV